MLYNRTKWNKDLVVSEINKLHEKGECLNASYIMNNYSKLYGAARKYLGSWRNAIENCGIDYDTINLRADENKWDTEKIKEEIAKLVEKGEPLNSDYIQKKYTKLHSAAQRYYSSWGDAVSKSGYDYDEVKGIKWTKETIVKEILKLSDNGEDLSSSLMQKKYMSLFQAGCRIFGSWKDAVKSSGLDYNEFRKQKEWTPTTVLEEISRYIEEKGYASAGLISKEYGALYQAARRNFKGTSWSEIVALAIAENKK